MIKNYWTAPNLTPVQHKQIKQAAAIMKAAAETKPKKNEVIRIEEP